MKRVIRFTASWCGPCKMLAKTLDEIETNIPIEVVDIDERSDVAIEFGVRSVPTLIMMDNQNNVSKRLVGVKPQAELQEWFND
jgi:thioredoxin 1